jgi:hypothetical protein
MKLRTIAASLVLTLTAARAWPATDDDIEIKGFHLGMKRWELKAHERDFCYSKAGCALSHKTQFTVGGVDGKLLTATFDDDAAVNSVEFVFDSFGFEQIRRALLEKYPHASCLNSEVITRQGIKLPQVICRFETDRDGIYLLRVAGNINRSLLFVMSADKRQEVRDHIAAATKDL